MFSAGYIGCKVGVTAAADAGAAAAAGSRAAGWADHWLPFSLQTCLALYMGCSIIDAVSKGILAALKLTAYGNTAAAFTAAGWADHWLRISLQACLLLGAELNFQMLKQ